MIKLKKVLATVMAATLIFSAVGCSMVEKTEEGINNTVVAKVYKQKITLGEVDASLGGFYNQLKQVYGENYKDSEEAMQYVKQQRDAIVTTLVDDVIFAKKAEEMGIMPSDEELDKQAKEKLDEIKANFESEEAFNAQLEASGFTEEQFLKELKLSIVFSLVREEVIKDVEATDEEIQTYYHSNQDSYTESPNKINPAHILVPTEEEANAIIERLNNGEDFAELAKELGTDSTKEKGGELGFIEYTSQQIDKTFLLAAVALEKGEYTKAPVQTKFGFHVIKCLDKEEYPVKPLEDVKEEVKIVVLEQNKEKKFQEIKTQWEEEAKIKKYDDKLAK